MIGYEDDEGILDTRDVGDGTVEVIYISDRDSVPEVIEMEELYVVMDILQKLTVNEEYREINAILFVSGKEIKWIEAEELKNARITCD